ncbi:hypothetical protein ABE426_15495 [Sphingobacterium faecium]|uniref:hypothetical protein n=1 Tax=Sphingobacterium faecium TaxID=34087 RepID=UPI00320ABB56
MEHIKNGSPMKEILIITPSTKMDQYIRDRINKESKPLEQHSSSKIDLKQVT